MNSNEIQKDKIKSTLIKIESLQKEYEVTLQQYQEAGQNYIASIQTTTTNPCEQYKSDSIGISQKCYDKIWSDQGCTTKAPDATTDWAKTQTLLGLVNDVYLWATLTDDDHRKGCYGDTTNYTTNTSPVYPNTTFFTALPGRTWWGTKGLTEGPANSQEECETMCANSEQCSGATFNPVKKYCWTRTGESNITSGQDSDYALITKQKEALSIMKYLNDRLLSLNEQIAYEFKGIYPEVKEQYDAKNVKQQQLTISYDKLVEQKRSLENQLREYNSIQQEEDNQIIYVNQQNMSFRFWFLVTGLVLLITIKRMIGSSMSPFSIVIWFLIILLLVILSYSLSTPAGFLVWFGFLVAVILRGIA